MGLSKEEKVRIRAERAAEMGVPVHATNQARLARLHRISLAVVRFVAEVQKDTKLYGDPVCDELLEQCRASVKKINVEIGLLDMAEKLAGAEEFTTTDYDYCTCGHTRCRHRRHHDDECEFCSCIMFERHVR